MFGISLLLLFHALGIPRSILTVVIGHIVISLPYTILVLMPRLQQIDVSLEEAAYDLGASRLRTFRSITLPLILPAVVSAFLIAFTTSFDEYAVASFVVGTRTTFPIYLYSALRFPNQLPQVIAVAVVVIAVSLRSSSRAEVGRRVAERRLGVDLASGVERRARTRAPASQESATAEPGSSSAERLVGEAVADDAARRACRRGTACTCRGRRPRRSCPRAASRRRARRPRGRRSARARAGPRRAPRRRLRAAADGHDDALALAEPRDARSRRRARRPSARARSASR